MFRYVANWLLQALPVLFGVSLVGFLIVRLAPGDPASLLVDLSQLTAEQQRAFREQLGLDRPLPVQYVAMVTAWLSGDLVSLRTGQSTLRMVADAAPVTLLLIGLAIVLSALIGISLGVVAARWPRSAAGRAVSAIAVLGLSLPQFWLGLVLITVLAAGLHWLPAAGIRPIGSNGGVLEAIPHLILPLIVLSAGALSSFIRFTRSAMLETLAQDYVRVARGKGLRERAVLFRHALPNALVTIVSLTGAMIPILLSNIVIVESVFALPGLGQLAVAAAISGDYPVVFTANMLAAVVVLLSSLLADVAYVLVDPRIRL